MQVKRSSMLPEGGRVDTGAGVGVEAGGRLLSLSDSQAEVLAEIAEREAGTEPNFLFTGHWLRTARALLHGGLVTECPRGRYWFTLSAAGAAVYDALPDRYRSTREWGTVRAAIPSVDRPAADQASAGNGEAVA